MGRPALTEARRLVVHGRVQGVGFRWFVREAARAAGVSGWVRNNPDGTVELVAGGEERAVDDLQRAVASGPAGAVVSRVEAWSVTPDAPLPHPFTVLR